MEHPFFATTDEDGNFEITGLPDGTYVLGTWAERFQKKGQEMTVTISGGETQEVEFVFKKPSKKKKKKKD